jgi:hypothetical protein
VREVAAPQVEADHGGVDGGLAARRCVERREASGRVVGRADVEAGGEPGRPRLFCVVFKGAMEAEGGGLEEVPEEKPPAPPGKKTRGMVYGEDPCGVATAILQKGPWILICV